ncbi:site-2 protease family protein [Merismopedia glauca]|uniref:Zinc metalloprotease n=1 Tax=Merismopedia glauca CCAP 1448/3 TaxID=1296344 RepID=A0A2T1BZP1_9CYAN|nr:site-2 protease family protein [Merismopedia glauca]PSB01343.1 site-2 protease family protein [Merismopedia glauca CCAP 1448/3]
MRAGWRIGSIFGIPLYIDSSWFVIFILIAMANFSDLYAVWGLLLAGIAGISMALLFFTSVLFHELGHSLVAMSQGIQVKSITLFFFGGLASIEKESKNPTQALQVALAGPGVSIILYGLFYLVTLLAPDRSLLQVIAEYLATLNLVLAVFNMLPGLPLDGGQALKALVWKFTGSRSQGVRWAANSGKIVGWIGIVLGLSLFLITGSLGGIWPALIGWFILSNANNCDRLNTLQDILSQLTAVQVMTREFKVVDARMSLRQFVDEYLLKDAWSAKGETRLSLPYYAAAEGRYRGAVEVEKIQNMERSLWETETLQTALTPLSEIFSLPENAPLSEVINGLEAENLGFMTILSPAGSVSGVIDRGDIVRSVAKRLNLELPEAEIQKIKLEGKYPIGLQLQAIAKTTN